MVLLLVVSAAPFATVMLPQWLLPVLRLHRETLRLLVLLMLLL
jgi:hypothetical protein